MQLVKTISTSSKKIKKNSARKSTYVDIDCFDNQVNKVLFGQSIYTFQNLLEFIRNRTNNYVTVQICDQDGEFFMIDRNTENIFEKGKEVIKKISLFELMIPISTKYMNENIQNQTVLSYDQQSTIFSYIIYSPNSRKKMLRYLANGVNSKQKTLEQKERLINSCKDRLKNEQQSLSDNNLANGSIDLYYKYMKYLTTRMTICQFHIDQNALQTLEQQSLVIVNHNSKIYKQIANGNYRHCLAVLETQENSEQPQFDFTIMKKDPRIQRYQKKMHYKLRQFQSDIKQSDIKLEYQSSKDSQEHISDDILQTYFQD